jgi:hypothetical protein
MATFGFGSTVTGLSLAIPGFANFLMPLLNPSSSITKTKLFSVFLRTRYRI